MLLPSAILGFQEQWVHDKYDGRYDSDFFAGTPCDSTLQGMQSWSFYKRYLQRKYGLLSPKINTYYYIISKRAELFVPSIKNFIRFT